jgi:hypothetical protein
MRLRNLIRLAQAVRKLAEQATWLDGEVEMALRHLRAARRTESETSLVTMTIGTRL